MLESEWFVLCACAKWLGDKKVLSTPQVLDATDPRNDYNTIKDIWEWLDEADMVVAHNGKRFDIPKINARFLKYDLKPPSPYKLIDTLLAARRYFAFTSNKLDHLGVFLNCGAKMETGGFALWRAVMEGDVGALKKMITYCKNDVILLEKVYRKLRPYITNHPNVGVVFDNEDLICPKCGSANIIKNGIYHTNVTSYQRYQCKDCGGYSRGHKNIREYILKNRPSTY